MNVGIDLVYICRLEKLINNDRFINKNFNTSEIEYIKKSNNCLSTIAGLYAGKEAFLKAIRVGLGSYLLKDIEITHDKNNAPNIILHNALFDDYKDNDISLSISHDGEYATAIVIIS